MGYRVGFEMGSAFVEMARPSRTLIWDVLTSDSLGWLDNSFLKIFNGTREVCRFAKTALRVCAMVVFDTARGLGALLSLGSVVRWKSRRAELVELRKDERSQGRSAKPADMGSVLIYRFKGFRGE